MKRQTRDEGGRKTARARMAMLLPRRRRSAEDEPLSKLLLYSVMAHYIAFFLAFGNPFLVLSPDQQKRSGGAEKRFDVELLNFPAMPEETPVPEGVNVFPSAPGTGTPAFSEGEPFDFMNQEDNPALEGSEESPPPEVSPDLLPPLSAADSPPPKVKKRAARKRMPPNMTGPEDCLLKVVGMVCPNGDIECITLYKEFCATLPH